MDDSYGFAEMHEQLLIIMDDIDRVCREHDIKYTLFYGTLLGAVRHKGFIPWDDDMDVGMLRSEFEKFRAVYPQEKNKDYIIGSPCNPAAYSVINPTYDISGIYHKDGTVINPWVTIFPMDSAPNNKTRAWLKATRLRLLSGMLGKPPQYDGFPKKSRRLWDITTFIGRVFGYTGKKEKYYASCMKDNDKNTRYLSTYTTNSKDAYKILNKDWFDDVQDMPFEDRIYKGITRFDEYLTTVYGDYMTPLPEDKRVPRHMNVDDK